MLGLMGTDLKKKILMIKNKKSHKKEDKAALSGR